MPIYLYAVRCPVVEGLLSGYTCWPQFTFWVPTYAFSTWIILQLRVPSNLTLLPGHLYMMAEVLAKEEVRRAAEVPW